MNITFGSPALPKAGALVVLCEEGGTLSDTGKDVDKKTKGILRKAMKANGFKGKSGETVEVIAPAGVAADRVIVAGIGKPKEASPLSLQKAGGAICGKLLGGVDKTAVLAADPLKDCPLSEADIAANIAAGARLRAYRFDKYLSKKKNDKKPKLTKLTITAGDATAARKAFRPLDRVNDGVLLARELVNEPSNVLFPAEFAARAEELEKLGVRVEVLDEDKMEELEMRALLGVGRGSEHGSRLVVMEWRGADDDKAKPVAFVGKGVTFDTGGISLKPGANMGDMKGDMGGAACVTGLMKALAGRKAKVNAVGVIGCVENMPDGRAQRPGDIVKSMSGQTIEILNTDAEGRLVLADALWYTQDRFKPQFMIDLATLTGAMLVALGQEYAGIFASDDELATRLSKAGEATDEKVWRLPLHDTFDKMIDTPNADMKNIGGRFAGSITAAQFLQRFTNKVPWVHIDIAGTAMDSPKSDLNQSWGSGFGVRLLDRLVADYYEEGAAQEEEGAGKE